MTDDHKHSGHFDAAMPLPSEVNLRHSGSSPTNDDDDDQQNPAADLIRKKVDAAYADAPPADEEIDEVSQLAKSTPQSKHQKFIDELINSGKSLADIQTAWHEYYAGLTDKDKHEVWREFYAQHSQNSHLDELSRPADNNEEQALVTAPRSRKTQLTRRADELRKKVRTTNGKRPSRRSATAPIHSLFFGLGIGSIVIVIFLFSFFNERFIAPFIQPSRNATTTPIINDSTAISPNPEIIIPKINVEIPVIYTVTTIDPDAVENALEDGVVHYADTAEPGQDGNGVIVGHSSNNIFNPGKYKFAFVLLSRLDDGDTFYLDKGGVRYTYQVYKKTIVSPTDVSVLGPQGEPATFSLITCDPPGTSDNRLVVVGEQISPSLSTNTAATSSNSLATKSTIIPGNSPTLWSRIVHFFEH